MSDRWLAILNGFGLTLGDSIIGLQALDAATALDALGGLKPVTFRLRPERSTILAELYEAAPHLCGVHPQPCHDIGRGTPARLIDLRDFAFDADFRGVAMIDFFLNRLGLDPAAVPSALKRNTWLARAIGLQRRDDLPERYVLVCPHAAMAMREMPEAAHAAVLAALLARQPFPVLTQGRPAAGSVERVAGVPPAGSLGALCELVAGASLVVSTDTAVVHLADAFAIPCLAVFTTHKPEWRVRDYPLCRPIYRPAVLPEAIEFARGPEDAVIAQAAWGPDLVWIEGAIDRMVAEFIRP